MPRKKHKNKRYSPELKITVVEAYFSGKGSMAELAAEVDDILVLTEVTNLAGSGDYFKLSK